MSLGKAIYKSRVFCSTLSPIGEVQIAVKYYLSYNERRRIGTRAPLLFLYRETNPTSFKMTRPTLNHCFSR
jgi:hypothetical protein